MSLYEIDTATRFTIIDALTRLALDSKPGTAALALDALRAIDAHSTAAALEVVLQINSEFSVRAE